MSDARAPGPEAGAARAEPAGAALSVDVAGLLAQLARSFVLLLPVYALGYLGLSFSWVLLALALLVWCRRSRGLKATRLCRALALLEDEERAVRLGVRACDLPAWVSGKRADPARPRPRPGPGVRAGTRAGRGRRPPQTAPTGQVEGAPRRAGPGRCRAAVTLTRPRRGVPAAASVPRAPPAVSAPRSSVSAALAPVARPPVRSLSPRCPRARWLLAAAPPPAPGPEQSCG